MLIAIDVGGTFIKYAQVLEDGSFGKKGKVPAPVGPDADAGRFADVICSLVRDLSSEEKPEGITMALPGRIDVDRGIVYGGGGLPYLDKIPLADLLHSRPGLASLPISMENDGKCAALAEAWTGNAKDAADAIVLVFGTGIGGGIIKDGQIHRGRRLLAGEMSFLLMGMTREDLKAFPFTGDPPEDTIYYESYTASARCSTGSLTEKAARLKGMPVGTLSGEDLFVMAKEGDADIKDLLDEMYFQIAQMCLSLYVAFDPDIILIGGGISEEPAFFEGIGTYVEKLKEIDPVYRELKLGLCRYRNDSNLIGAVRHFRLQHGQQSLIEGKEFL